MQLVKTEGGLQVGGNLSQKQKSALDAAAISPEDILKHLDGLAEEIQETYVQPVPEVKVAQPAVRRPQPVRPVPAALAPVPVAKSRVEQRVEEVAERIPDPEPEPESDLDSFLDGAEEAAATGPSLLDQVRELLGQTRGAPDQRQLDAWKQQYGDIYCFALGPGDVYIFTFLKRSQWQRISEVMKEFQSKGGMTGDKYEQQLKEKVVQNCTLFPKPLTAEFFINSRAGVVDGIFEAIMFHSAFLNPQQVVNLTVQL